MTSLIPHYYNEDALTAALQLAATMAIRDFREVLLKVPTKVKSGDEYDTLDQTNAVMDEICEAFIRTLELKLHENTQKTMKQVAEYAKERDGI